MAEHDIASILTIQAAAYPTALHEDEQTIRSRLQAVPDCAWVAADNDGIRAYLVAYRTKFGKVTPFAAPFFPSVDADCLYLHDLAVCPTAAGRGLGPALVRMAWATARQQGLVYSALVSVQGSQDFWRGLDYRPASPFEARQQTHLRTYPSIASYMVKDLS